MQQTEKCYKCIHYDFMHNECLLNDVCMYVNKHGEEEVETYGQEVTWE